MVHGGYLWGEAGAKPPLAAVLGDQASILGLLEEPASSNAASGTFSGFTEKLPRLPEQSSKPQPIENAKQSQRLCY